MRKRTASCILPGKRRRDGLRALAADLIVPQVEVGQRGIDHAHEARDDDGIGGLQVLAGQIHRCRGLQLANRKFSIIKLELGQRGLEKPNA